jgi:hypothetical protein
MEKQTHTPGPWAVRKNPNTVHSFDVFDANGIRLAEVMSGPAVLTPGNKWGAVPELVGTQGEVNARLIAAAPTALDALRKAYKALMTGRARELALIDVSAAIAKAEAR